MSWSSNRRAFLRAAALSCTAAIAGCIGGEATPASGGQPSTTTRSEQTTDAESTTPQSLHDFVASANTPQGWTDHRYDSSVSITVGSHALPFAFQPALTRIAPGTTVTWEWSEHGGEHNVVALDDAFDSGEPVSGAGHTFEYRFTETGTHRYVSEPCRDCGMKGIVAVEETPTSGYPEVDRWLAPVSAYDGTVATDTTTVTVGETDDSEHAFDPLVLKVPAGTTVSWRWTADGQRHNVGFETADIEPSGLTSDAGVHFEHTFDSTGTYRYACTPHKAIGERGAIIVE